MKRRGRGWPMKCVYINLDRATDRRASLEARASVLSGGKNDLLARLEADPAFAAVRGEIASMVVPEKFVGLAPRQVDRFLAEHVEPALAPYRGRLGADASIRV